MLAITIFLKVETRVDRGDSDENRLYGKNIGVAINFEWRMHFFRHLVRVSHRTGKDCAPTLSQKLGWMGVGETAISRKGFEEIPEFF